MAKVTLLVGMKNHFSEEAINEIINSSEYPEITKMGIVEQEKAIDRTLEALHERGYSYSSTFLNSGIEVFTLSINTSNYWKFYEDLTNIGMELLGMDDDEEEDEDE